MISEQFIKTGKLLSNEQLLQSEFISTGNKNILKDGRLVGQGTRFSKPKFRIIGVLIYI